MNHSSLEIFALVSTVVSLCCSAVFVIKRRGRQQSALTFVGSALLLAGLVEIAFFHHLGEGIVVELLGSVLLVASNTLLVAWRNR